MLRNLLILPVMAVFLLGCSTTNAPDAQNNLPEALQANLSNNAVQPIKAGYSNCPSVIIPESLKVSAPKLGNSGKMEIILTELQTGKFVFADNYQLATDIPLTCVEDANSYLCGKFLVRKYVSGDLANAEYLSFSTFKVRVAKTFIEKDPLSGAETQKISLAVVSTSCEKAEKPGSIK